MTSRILRLVTQFVDTAARMNQLCSLKMAL